jgi:hypothetical protein
VSQFDPQSLLDGHLGRRDLGVMSILSVGVWVLAATLMLAPDAASGAVLCAKQRSDGTFGSTVKIREVCRAKEVQLAPQDVGFCCSATTTSTTSTSLGCPTTTTLGIPDCQAGAGCGFPCFNGQTCTDQGGGQCACTGPVQCGGTFSVCGGECPVGQACTPKSVPPGCGSIGCTCQ